MHGHLRESAVLVEAEVWRGQGISHRHGDRGACRFESENAVGGKSAKVIAKAFVESVAFYALCSEIPGHDMPLWVAHVDGAVHNKVDRRRSGLSVSIRHSTFTVGNTC